MDGGVAAASGWIHSHTTVSRDCLNSWERYGGKKRRRRRGEEERGGTGSRSLGGATHIFTQGCQLNPP